jgi:hypothetical protein
VLLFSAVHGNQLVVPHMNFAYLSRMANILHKRQRLCSYKVLLGQALEPDDHPRRAAYAKEMLQRFDEDNDYLTRVYFSEKATCHTTGKVNRHNVHIWGLENPRVVLENERNSPK